MAVLVELGSIGDRLFAVGPPRDAGRDRPLGQGCADPVAVIPLIGEQDLRVRQDGAAPWQPPGTR